MMWPTNNSAATSSLCAAKSRSEYIMPSSNHGSSPLNMISRSSRELNRCEMSCWNNLNRSETIDFKIELPVGFEPTTAGLQGQCSGQTELRQH